MNMKIHQLLFLGLVCVWTHGAYASPEKSSPRTTILLNKDWGYKPITEGKKNAPLTSVTLPHTWNAQYIEGTSSYNREMMIYRRDLEVTSTMNNKRLFLYFEGVNSAANVFVNHKTAGTHLGGYTAFCLEITDYVKQGNNKIEVWASNAFRTDVLPISGDFNVYGGIHRPCHLIITEKNCISPLFYASPGVFIHQNKVSNEMADITVESILSLKELKPGLRLKTTILDADNQIVGVQETTISGETIKQSFTIAKPHLWNGKQNPYLYKVSVELYDNEKLIDKVTQRTGFRYFSVDPQKGFYLNGKHLDLHGFCIHEDVKGKGSALTREDYETDMNLINEVGATSMRLTHYPHAEPIYNLCDENGIVLWTEIAMCGPGGYDFAGYLHTEAFENNARQILKELVYQKFNHPSICFWGIFNEILMTYDDPQPFTKELNRMYKALDPSRLTTIASCTDQKYYRNCSDVIAWNKYAGWYGGSADNAGNFFDSAKNNPDNRAVGISEYGAGASIHHHQWPLSPDNKADGHFHPEEWQNVCHEGSWKAFAERPFMWGKYIWVFADFQSTIRKEGDTDGINDKGLITYDRKTKKDAFYFYKANWNPEPMIYISSRRFTERTDKQVQIKVYTNLEEATLYINEKKIGKRKKDEINRIIWDNIMLFPGENVIRVEGKQKKTLLKDSCVWNVPT